MASNRTLEFRVRQVFNIHNQLTVTPIVERILDEIIDKDVPPKDLKPETLQFFLESLDLGTLMGVKRGDYFDTYEEELSLSYEYAVKECAGDIVLSYFSAQEVLDQVPFEVKAAYVKRELPELFDKPYMRQVKYVEKALVMIGSSQWGRILYKPRRNVRARMDGR